MDVFVPVTTEGSKVVAIVDGGSSGECLDNSLVEETLASPRKAIGVIAVELGDVVEQLHKQLNKEKRLRRKRKNEAPW